MDGPTAAGPLQLQRFYLGPPPAGTGPLTGTVPSSVMWIITVIDVVYDGTGSAPLIQFGVGEVPPAFWASAPNSGTVHTEQYRGLVVLTPGDSLWADGDPSQWDVHVAGYVANFPAM
jgi:hypothetical protein